MTARPGPLVILSPHEPVILLYPDVEVAEAFWPEWALPYSSGGVPALHVSLPDREDVLLISVPRSAAGFLPPGLEGDDRLIGAVITRPPWRSPLGVMLPAGIYETDLHETERGQAVRLQYLRRILPLSDGPRWCVFHLPTRARGYRKRRDDVTGSEAVPGESGEDEMREILRRIYSYESLVERVTDHGTFWVMRWHASGRSVETVFRVVRAGRGERVRLHVERAGLCIAPDATISPFLLDVIAEIHSPGETLRGGVLVQVLNRRSR